MLKFQPELSGMDLIPVSVGQAELGPVLWSADDTLGVQPQRPLLKDKAVI